MKGIRAAWSPLLIPSLRLFRITNQGLPNFPEWRGSCSGSHET
jgi:hypothetical protein